MIYIKQIYIIFIYIYNTVLSILLTWYFSLLMIMNTSINSTILVLTLKSSSADMIVIINHFPIIDVNDVQFAKV